MDMRDARIFWNERAKVYDGQVSGVYAEAYEKTAARTLKYLKPEDRVLEFACGTGIVTLSVADHVYHVQAIDISEEMACRAAEKVRQRGMTNVDVMQMDIFDPSLEPGSFDAVLAFNVLCYLDDFDRVVGRIRELLRPGGMFLSATDCLGQGITAAGVKKLVKSRTGRMPYVAFFNMKGLEKRVTDCGFSVLERENLFDAPPNLFLAARKTE